MNEYRYMSDGGLESDRRKLESYLRYCDSEDLAEDVRARIKSIMFEQDVRRDYPFDPDGRKK